MKLTGYIILIYGLLVLFGGMMGYHKAHSLPSLIMGSVFALLLAGTAIGILNQSVLAYFCAISLATILLLFFTYRFYVTQHFMPSGMMAIISLLVLVGALVAKFKKL